MADASTVSLLPVIVGGLLTVTGGVIGGGITLLVKWVETNDEKKKRRAEKFEELVVSIFEHKHWLDTAKNIRVFGDGQDLNISPIVKVSAIMATHFPEFDEQVRSVEVAGDEYELWMFKARQKRLNKEPNYSDGFQEPWRSYLKALNTLMNELKSFAKREFQ